ncbi:cobyric acid synthase [Methanocorpusculum sp. GPch4]|jgi:adenosylcobyric acid synthase|uniref:cobyric acid synthase n=1 Tax=Methanocorpusculum sp. GPch4 TaxID=2527877 RepID=UPI0014334178|nr:cobyric acid synthase [Methanocorpusculum sp. GPch4]
MAKKLMIQGTMSNVGKTTLTAGLCRILAQDGHRVAPFKPQNLASAAYVTKSGDKIGIGQAVQAEAAGIEPDGRMNPVLVKPCGSGTEVCIRGKPVPGITEYGSMTKLMPEVLSAFQSLEKEYDIIIIEGAGAAAELNLMDRDIANMGFAKKVSAPVIIVGDIERGGVFASLYGTFGLFDDAAKKLVRGFVINRLSGDPKHLGIGPSRLTDLTGVPVLGVVPKLDIHLQEEDIPGPIPRDDSLLENKAYREHQLDLLADALRKALDMDAVYKILEENT